MQEEIYEALEVIEEPSAEVVEVEMLEAFQAPATADNLNHALLNNREISDAHPITAITGLRTELDSIEALQTIYSDKKGNADYYEWADDQAFGANGVGYFVTLNQSINKISICTGDDIFGVVVPDAAFVGGQADTPRDGHYGLVAISGAVPVRCEIDVAEGDYVVSSAHGVATKATSGYGYQVVALQTINSVQYAIINFNITADQANLMGIGLQNLNLRMNAAESNIISAVNMANEAHQKALSVEASTSAMSGVVSGAVNAVGRLETTVGDMEEQVTNAVLISTQAQELANSTLISATSIANDAVIKANEAIAENTELKESFELQIGALDDNLKGAVGELAALKTDLQPLAMWPADAGIDDATGFAGFVAQANADSSILGTMVGRNGNAGETLAGFIQEATETRATVRGIVSYQKKDADGNPTGESGAAGLMAQVDDTQSEVSAIANYTFTKNNGATETGLAGLNAYVNETESNISLLSNRVSGKYTIIHEEASADKRDTSKFYASYDSQSTVTTYYYYTNKWNPVTDWNSLPGKQTDVIYYIAPTKLYWYYESNVWKSTANAYTAGLPTAIGSIQIETDANSSSINSLVSWQDDTNSSMARLEKKADANGAYIQSTVSNIDKYAVGPLSQAYGFTLEQAAQVLEEGTMYVTTIDKITSDTQEEYKRATEALLDVGEANRQVEHVYKNAESTKYYYYGYNDGYKWLEVSKFEDVPAYTRKFLPGYLYRWGRINGTGHYGWTTVDKLYRPIAYDEIANIANTSAKAVYFQTNAKPTVASNDTWGYWYTNGDTLTGTAADYSSRTLYKWMAYKYQDGDNDLTDAAQTDHHWVAVATLANNSSNRAVSQIRQDANSIEARVTNTEGSVASVSASLTTTQANVDSLVLWSKGGDENGTQYNLATMKQTADDNGSSITQMVTSIGGCLMWDGSSARETDQKYYYNNKYYYYDGEWKETSSASQAGVVINAASIVTAVNDSDSSVVINADHLSFEGETFDVVIRGTVDEVVDDLNMGTCNLLPKVKFGTNRQVITANSESGFGYICTANTSSVSVFGQTEALGLKSGQDYTLTFKAWCTTPCSICWDLWVAPADGDEEKLPQEWFNVTSTPTLFKWTFKCDETFMPKAALRFINADDDGSPVNVASAIYVTDIQVVNGNTASSWTPAPEDTKDAARNLAKNSTIKHSFSGQEVKVYTTPYPWSITKSQKYDGTYIDSTVFEVGETYTLSYRFKKTAGTLENIGGHIGGATEVSFYLDGESKSGYPGQASNVNDDTNEHYVVFTFKYGGSDHIYIQPNRGSDTSVTYDLWNIKVEKGTTASTWSSAPEDVVGGNDIVTRINASQEGVLIQGDKVNILGNTTFTSLTKTENGQTFIDGGQIKTGTVTADRLTVYDSDDAATKKIVFQADAGTKNVQMGGWHVNGESLYSGTLGTEDSVCLCSTGTTDNANIGGSGSVNNWCITAGDNFGVRKDGSMYAQQGKVAGWDITESAIEFKESNQPVVGMYSGDASYASLVPGGDISPVRFYAGAWGEVTEPVRLETISFTTETTLDALSEEIALTEQEKQNFKIVEAQCLTTTNSFSATSQSDLQSIPLNTLVTTTFTNMCPEWVTETHLKGRIAVFEPNSQSLDQYTQRNTVTYEGSGTFKVVTSLTNWNALPNSTIIGRIRLEVAYDEPLDYQLSFNDEKCNIQFNPKQTNSDYTMQVTYRIDVKNQNFKVLEDGSLYASAARIAGHVEADSGSFKGHVEADSGSFKGHVEADSGSFKGHVEADSGQIGGLSIGQQNISSGDGGLTFESSGLIIANRLQVETAIRANGLQSSAISGVFSDSPRIILDGENTVYKKVTVSVTWDIVSTGHINVVGAITDYGQVNITVTTSEVLGAAKTLTVWGSATRYVTVEAGTNSATTTMPYYYGSGNFAAASTFGSATVSPATFDVPTSNTTKTIIATHDVTPISNAGQALGASDKRWKEIWCHQSALNTPSDRNEKNSIEAIPKAYEAFFDELRPVRYRFNINDSNRYHMGFISQEVRDALGKTNISTTDFAGYLEYDKEDGSRGYGLRYGEFIALCVHEIQKLKKRVEELEEKLETK